MAIKTIFTSAGDFKLRLSEHDDRSVIASRIARRLGYPGSRWSNSSGSHREWQIQVGWNRDGGLQVDKQITVFS